MFFKKPSVTDDFINLGSSSISFMIFILNIIVVSCTLNTLSSLMNFFFSLNLLKTFPWWYPMHTMFFFFVRIISSYCFIMLAASSIFSTLSAFSFNSSSLSTLPLLIIESISCYLISSLLSVLIFLALSEPFFNYNKK